MAVPAAARSPLPRSRGAGAGASKNPARMYLTLACRAHILGNTTPKKTVRTVCTLYARQKRTASKLCASQMNALASHLRARGLSAFAAAGHAHVVSTSLVRRTLLHHRHRVRTPWLQGMRRRRRAANARCRHPARAPEFWGPVGMVRRERAQAAAPLASPAWRHFLDALLSGRSRRRRWWKARDGELRDEHNFGTLACWRQHGVAAGAAAVGGSAAGVEALAAAAAGRCRCSR
jgi:hypothetical protein